MTNEVWKDVVGYEGLYKVSNLGRIKSLHQYKGTDERCIQPIENGRGYLFVGLHKDRQQRHRYIHRIVAEAFIDNPDGLPQVNHKDENKANNSVDNLEWCTNEYNENYGTGNLRSAKARSKAVVQYDRDGNIIKVWDGMSEAAKALGKRNNHIHECCKGKIKTAHGYVWRYA